MTQATQTAGRHLDDYALMDRYTRQSGRVLLTGTQALVRILAPRAAPPRVAVHTTAVLRGKAEPARLATKAREALRTKVQVARARVAASNTARAIRPRMVHVAAINRRGTH